MFDIKEYYYNNEYLSQDLKHDIVNIDDDITYDINNLLSSRFDSLYVRDRYKNFNSIIEIIYPRIQYPGNSSLIMTPDRIRYLLSFYPKKEDFYNIDKIVLRPRFIEIGNIELISLYLRRKKILILYLFHPHFYKMNTSEFSRYNEFIAMDLEKIIQNKLMDNTVLKDKDTEIQIHPLWYLMSIISHIEDDKIDKFFLKKDIINDKMYGILNDISFFYSQHGF